ncbi:MAG TPA: RibD family protein, partial [Syntrophales bacterium]|nr:RibD family protein [Syntrophales bacterium]
LFTTPGHDGGKLEKFYDRGVAVEVLPGGPQGGVDLAAALESLAGRGVSSLLVEGGGSVITSFVREGKADRYLVIVAPKLAGKGIEAVGDLGFLTMDEAVRLRFRTVRRYGDDVVLDARPLKRPA